MDNLFDDLYSELNNDQELEQAVEDSLIDAMDALIENPTESVYKVFGEPSDEEDQEFAKKDLITRWKNASTDTRKRFMQQMARKAINKGADHLKKKAISYLTNKIKAASTITPTEKDITEFHYYLKGRLDKPELLKKFKNNNDYEEFMMNATTEHFKDKKTSFMAKIYSAQEEGNSELLDQVANDIEAGLSNIPVETVDYDIRQFSSDSVVIIDKKYDECTHCLKDKEGNLCLNMMSKEFTEDEFRNYSPMKGGKGKIGMSSKWHRSVIGKLDKIRYEDQRKYLKETLIKEFPRYLDGKIDDEDWDDAIRQYWSRHIHPGKGKSRYSFTSSSDEYNFHPAGDTEI